MREYYLVSGANGDIGESVVRQLVTRNKNVIGLTRENKNGADYTEDDLVEWVACDYIQNTMKDSRIENILKENKLVGVVHCAGAYLDRSPMETTETNYQAMLQANLFTAISIVNYSIKNLEKGSGIVVLNSQASASPSSNEAAYGLSKAALSSYIQSMQPEATSRGLQLVNVLCGAVRTKMCSNRPGNDLFIEIDELANTLVDLLNTGPSLRIKDIEILRRRY